jgi:citrate synthase
MNLDRVMEGLEGVLVTRTALSRVDGEAGRLVVAGQDVESLARAETFETAAARLFALAGLDAGDVAAEMARGRLVAFEAREKLRPALDAPEAMVALRVAVDLLPADLGPAALAGALGAVAAMHARAAAPGARAPSPALSHASDILAMMLGAAPAGRLARALDAYLVTVMDHGMNASTFAARVVASTGADVSSCVVAALAALKGPLHGGAPGPVLDMLDAIGQPSHAEAWLSAELAAGRRIMGMGHRVYRVRDPRAAVLERACADLESEGLGGRRLALARAVEKTARGILASRYPNRALDTNVEFYTALLLDSVGVPRTHFSAIFAAGRVAGWLAHVAEQRKNGRLIRPDALYVGPVP